MSVKDIKAEETTVTYDRDKIEENVGSIYEAIVIMGKRAEQINAEIRTELHNKLDEFAIHNTTLEEVFENREQIEISKHYEKLPKPTSMAIAEWLNGDIYFRETGNNSEN
ncbi:DNA-directed RNA polymerase subunit omega [Weeksellaceae bacterium A-14]|uniref:DNA-directed RNA polymerase subunit omega n=1 Tax=Daejeonia sp. YH14 TaxID=3439042 RepID=UPI0031E4A697